MESQVLLSVALSAACLVTGGSLLQASPGLFGVARGILGLGMLAVVVQAFRWGTYNGYRIRGEPPGVRVESVLRCAAMSFVMYFWSLLLAAFGWFLVTSVVRHL